MTIEDMEVKRQMSELEAEDERMVAPKWWGTVDTVMSATGKMRKVHECEINDQTRSLLLSRPSVRYRKTVNAYSSSGKRVAVNAQQYAVLVTNVTHACYPEYTKLPKKPLKQGMHVLPPGAGCCGNYPEMTQEDIERAAEEGEAARVYRASKSGGGDKSAAGTPTAAGTAGWAPGSKYMMRNGDGGSGSSSGRKGGIIAR